MSTLWKTALAVSVTLFALSTISGAAQTTSAPPSALDATVFTTYSLSSGDQNVSLSVCGSLPGSEGCYGGAFLGPFGKIGALLEGNPSTKGNTVIRAIYVLDIATGTTGAPVCSARRPTPRRGCPSGPGRVRVPSGKITTQSPRSRIRRAVSIAC